MYKGLLITATFAGFLLAGCDSSSAPTDATLNATNDQGQSVRVQLVEGTPASHRTFTSRADFETYMEGVDASSSFIVNESVWRTVGHALSPGAAAAFDASHELIIGDSTYRATRTGVYRRATNVPGSEMDTELFYGEDGQAEGDEYAQVAANSATADELESLELRNPHVRALADRLIDAINTYNRFDGNYCGSSYTWEDCYMVYPGTTVYESGTNWSIRFVGYNQSSGSIFSKKAYGGTQPQVYATTSAWSAVGVNNPSSIGNHLGHSVRVYGNATTSAYNSCNGRLATDYYPAISCAASTTAESGRSSGFEAISDHTWRADNSSGSFELD